jgi:hypothetical protein
LARKRFFTLTALRFAGVASAFIGISILAKRWVEPAEIIGGFLLANGIIDVLVVPMILIRRWRSEP